MSINRDLRRGFLKYFVVIGFVLFFMATVAIADVGAVDTNELVAMNISVEDSPVPEGGRIEYLAFDNNKSIREGLRILQARFQKNIVPSSKVDGQKHP
jgi:hypothetical protein